MLRSGQSWHILEIELIRFGDVECEREQGLRPVLLCELVPLIHNGNLAKYTKELHTALL